MNAANSAMGFAKIVMDDDEEINDVGGEATHSTVSFNDGHHNVFKLATVPAVPPELIVEGIEAYFDRFHWFVLLLHEPIFRARASSIISRTTWKQEELCDVILVLLVAILGLKCASDDPSWKGHPVMVSHRTNADAVLQTLLKEVGVHFYDIMTQSSIESYQISMLLEVYHVYFGSISFARHMAGAPARVAYGLGLHCDKPRNMDETAYQVGARCWNHAVVGELFASMIYGQPSSLDPAFSRFRNLSELDETLIPPQTAALPIIANSQRYLSTLTFHVLKFALYEVIQGILEQNKFVLNERALSLQDLRALIQSTVATDTKLKRWRSTLPAVFDPSQWNDSDPWDALQAQDSECTPDDRSCRRKLALQGIILQVLHDSAIILAHRPLLQCRIALTRDDHSSQKLQDAPDSLGISAGAALRISRIPVKHFRHQLALSFVCVHLFTAGAILCVPPIYLPYSGLAADSKAGVLRIISACRALSSTNSIALHTDQVLTKLYRKTIQREMDSALRNSAEGFVHAASHGEAIEAVYSPPRLSTPEIRGQQTVEPPVSHVGPEINQTTTLVANVDHGIVAHTQTVTESLYENLDVSDMPVVPYLQFTQSLNQDGNVGAFLSEHLDDTFGAFDHMYELNFMGGLSSDVFTYRNGTSFS